jgi:hypothetical protein
MGSGTSGYINWTITPSTHYHSLVGNVLCDNRHLPALGIGDRCYGLLAIKDQTSLFHR